MDLFSSWLESGEAFSSQHKRPQITLCYAQSLDGSITFKRGIPLLISGGQSTNLTHRLRSFHDAIMVGIGTILSDNPLLTVRHADGVSPQPVVLDSKLRISPDCRIVQDHPKKPWLASSQPDRVRKKALERLGCRILQLPAATSGGVDLPSLLLRLWGEGIRSVMLEGGARLISSFMKERLIDYAVITISPHFVGGLNVLEKGLFSSDGDSLIYAFPNLQKARLEGFGDDIVVWGRVSYP